MWARMMKKLGYDASAQNPTTAAPAVNSDAARRVPQSPSVTKGTMYGYALGGQAGGNAPHLQALLKEMGRSDDDEDASKGCCLPGLGKRK